MKNRSLMEKFVRYVKLDTQSDEHSGTNPSTAKQHELAKMLVKELEEMGAQEITYDEKY